MHRFRPLFLCLCLCLSPSGGTAQEAVPQPLEIGPSGRAYLEAIRYRGVETDVGYFDPTGAVPRLETGQNPAPPPKSSGDDQSEGDLTIWQLLILLLATAILAGLATLILRTSGSFALSLDGDAQNPGSARRRTGSARGRVDPGPPAELRAILAVADRRRALVMLAQAALARTVAANGVLLQSSWTMRDALRHIPGNQSHLDALRHLALAAERVLFGNRDVTEDEFQAQVAGVRPLMGAAVPA